MAHTRLEKIGTIHSRISFLLRGKAIKEEDVPMWYHLYSRFPPMYEPRYDREVPKTPLRQIYYKEDILRARICTDIKKLTSKTVLDLNSQKPSITQNFMKRHAELVEMGESPEEVYNTLLKELENQVSQES